MWNACNILMTTPDICIQNKHQYQLLQKQVLLGRSSSRMAHKYC